MTEENKKLLGRLIILCAADHDPVELTTGFLRFEALRRLKPSQFAELHKRNLAGERFDDMIDDLIVEWSRK